MKQVLLISLSFLAACARIENETPDKPNVIFIMLDDFGYSQIAYNSEQISVKDYDPLFLEFTLNKGNYAPEEALEFSRRATPTLSRMAREGVIFNGSNSLR